MTRRTRVIRSGGPKVAAVSKAKQGDNVGQFSRYATTIAGAALRHDFGLHISSIGRNTGEILDHINDRPDKKKILFNFPHLEPEANVIDELSTDIHNLFSEMGDDLNLESRMTRSRLDKLDKTIVRKIGQLEKECDYFEQYVRRINDPEIATLAKDSVTSSERIRLMYLGLRVFLKPGKQNYSVDGINLRRLLRRIARSIRTDVVGLHLSEILIEGDAEIEGVSSQLTSVFQNLLHNAAKFSSLAEDPFVDVRVNLFEFRELRNRYSLRYTYLGENEPWACVQVLNSGPKIPKEDENRIFDLAYSKSPTGAPFSGSGMGLAIAKLFVTNHGGLIFADLNSKFTELVVLLPVRQSARLEFNQLIRRGRTQRPA